MSDLTPDDRVDAVIQEALRAEADGVNAGSDLFHRVATTSGHCRTSWGRPAPWVLVAAALALVAGISWVLIGATSSDVEVVDVVDGSGRTSTTLVEGPTTTTLMSTTTSASTTTSTPPAAVELQLQGDGLGAVPFGTTFEASLAVLVARLGDPEVDSGVQAFEVDCDYAGCRSASPECSTAQVYRTVGWPGLGLTFYGHDGDSLRFEMWSAGASHDDRDGSIATAAGLRMTDALARWRDAYGSDFTTTYFQGTEEPGGPWVESVRLHLADGVLTGVTEFAAPPTQLQMLITGLGCHVTGDY